MRCPRRITTLSSVLVLVCVVGAGAGAQATTSPEPLVPVGSRVRLRSHHAPDTPMSGWVEAVRGDTLLVRSDGAPTPIPLLRADIARLEVYRRGRVAETAGIIGGTLGAIAGASAYSRWCDDNRDHCRDNRERSDSTSPRYDHSVSRTSVYILGGAVLGGLASYFLAPPQWEVVGTPVQVNVAPVRRGLAVGATLRFGRPLPR